MTHTHTHLLFGLALPLSDVGGDDPLRLFSQAREGAELQRHTHGETTHTHTQGCTAAAGVITHTVDSFVVAWRPLQQQV